MSEKVCQSCGAEDIRIFYAANQIPIHSCRLCHSKEESLALPKGDLSLGFCSRCGFIQNCSFNKELVDYSENYEDTQSFSSHFRSYAAHLADQLLDRYELFGKTVLEIGCGQGDFLELICTRGSMRGIGFDPAYRPPANDRISHKNYRINPTYYSRETCRQNTDLILCRHTLEHIPRVKRFLRMLRVCADEQPAPVVCFEVPDVERVLREDAFWDLYYEHCSYFTVDSLRRLFDACGFSVLDVRKTYGNQYIVLEARPRTQTQPDVRRDLSDLGALSQNVEAFRVNVAKTLKGWLETLRKYRAEGRRVALWGAGSKASGFLTALGVTNEVGCVVDINPKKHGFFQAGTEQRIVGPHTLNDFRPDLVIVMNPVYRREIEKDLESMGLTAKVLAL